MERVAAALGPVDHIGGKALPTMKLNQEDRELLLRYRWNIACRILAAILGGYALSAVFSLFLSITLSLDKAGLMLTAILVSFAVYTGAVVWAVLARSAWKVWTGLITPCLVFAGVSLLLVWGVL